MISHAPSRPPQKEPDDLLSYLPCSHILQCREGQVIYSQKEPSANLYLVIQGKVTVSCLADDGRQVIIDIYGQDDFFGESAMLPLVQHSEQALAREHTKLMSWTPSEIEGLTLKHPRLGIAILQMLVQRSGDLTQRIESLSTNNIPRRLARTLIRLSDRLGETEEDGSRRMMPLAHEFLAQYVGTSREVVTQYMNQLRRLGYLRYSRKGIIVYRNVLSEWLR
jgi:CRP/FNR family transcriptional regulator